MKGILLAGGRGSRLFPTTKSTCKQLLPIYDKPLIYYSLSVLLQAQIRDVMLISTPEDQPKFEELLGDGGNYGISLSYGVQDDPRGIADAFLIAEEFIGSDSVALVLGDNIFYGDKLSKLLKKAKGQEGGAQIFGYEVHDPERYGVIAFGEGQKVEGIIEKPVTPPSRYAVTGLYFYDNQVVEIAKGLQLSPRGELEITDVNMAYLKRGELSCHLFDRGFAWLDTGTPSAMLQAANFVQTLQERQGIKIGCLEELAYQLGFIDEEKLQAVAEELSSSEYGKYLLSLCRSRLLA